METETGADGDPAKRGVKWAVLCVGVLMVGLGCGLASALSTPSPGDVELAGFATSLKGRTRSQRHNAVRSAKALNGQIVLPGAVFSFNHIVRSWSWDQGYVKAPVSYDGELVLAYGGGVCQTSTTLYNAVLLAGLPVLERHSHVFAPRYVPPGRDAAVAQRDIDLRFRNPYAWPIRIRASAEGERLEVRLIGAEQPPASVQIVTNPLSIQPPARLTRVVPAGEGTAGRAYIRNPGATGYRVVTCRSFVQNGREIRRERLSDDTYQAMNRVIHITE